MDLRKIKALLESYYEGKTGSDEESLLTDFFVNNEVPAEMETDRSLFLAMKYASAQEIPDKEFDSKLFDAIKDNERIRKQAVTRKLAYTISGIAASILLIAGSYFLFHEKEAGDIAESSDQYSEQEMLIAYNEAKHALLLVSAAMNTGTDQLEALSKMTEATRELGAINKIHYGAAGLSIISKFDETVSGLQPDENNR